MSECQPCQTIDCTVPDDLDTYSLQSWINFLSPTLGFIVQCPVGYQCAPGLFPRTVTYPPGRFVIVYPPNPPDGYVLRLQGCQSEVTRTVPAGATQEIIDALLLQIITEVGQQQAECDSIVNPPAPNPADFFLNSEVYFSHACPEGEELSYTANLPSWITLDTVNSRLVGMAGIFAGLTQELADEIAQTHLDSFGTDALSVGTLTCGCPLPNISWAVTSETAPNTHNFDQGTMQATLVAGATGGLFMEGSIADGPAFNMSVEGTGTFGADDCAAINMLFGIREGFVITVIDQFIWTKNSEVNPISQVISYPEIISATKQRIIQVSVLRDPCASALDATLSCSL